MDRLKAMRQRDWARLFGFLCVVAGLGLSVAGYAGAQWDALICWLGALMLLRAAVAQVYWVLRLVSFMFAFAAVNRAQDGVEGAAVGALGNGILWAVGLLLIGIAAMRKVPMWAGERVWLDLGAPLAGAVFFWVFYNANEAPDMALLRFLIALAVILNIATFFKVDQRGVTAGVGFGVGMAVLIATPGGAFLPIGLFALVGALGMVLLWRLGSRANPGSGPGRGDARARRPRS